MPGYEIFGEEERRHINEVLDTGVLFRYEFGEQRKGIHKVREFEEKFAAYTSTTHAQAVTSGSAALKVALIALGIGPGDEVITQGFTFVATWEAILEIGATPVFAEIDDTLNLDPDDIENKITDKTKCIIPVHMMGAPARIEKIVAIGEKYDIPILEDTAQATGARLNGRHLGSFGACGTFSFDSVKTLTTGEGGMIITRNADLWRKMSEYHDHGHDHAENPGGRGADGRRFFGSNYRMMELQGAIGLGQMEKLDSLIAIQRTNKARLKKILSDIPGVSFRTILDESGDNASFVAFLLPNADESRRVNEVLRVHECGAVNFSENSWHYYTHWEHLLGEKTVTRSGYPFADVDGRRRIHYDENVLPKTAAILTRTLCYPINVKMDDAHFEKIKKAVVAISA
ncbi:MAG: DegT/DnrJ/EryC1/StrS family aminotransferase [Desulforhopalus sp.]|nr:DegT/DnrJ/EryC1/StrS family aminotransferase [Desulforhopalus sp.]